MKFPDEPRDGFPLKKHIKQILAYLRASTITGIQGGRFKESPNGRFIIIPPASEPKKATPTKPPLWGTLKWDGETPQLFMEYGVLHDWKDGTGDAITEWEITGLPEKDAPVTVAAGDKISVKVTSDDGGVVTAVDYNKSGSWPTSTAPSLKGGDNTSGSSGIRYIRILEIITDPDRAHRTIIKHHNTGNIDHKPATMVDNSVSAYSTGLGARFLRYWNHASKRWDIRGAKKGKGQLTITEGTTDNEFRGNLKKGKITYTIGAGSPVDLGVNWNDGLMIVGADEEDPAAPVAATEYNIPIPSSANPWQVTSNGDDTVNVGAGMTLGNFSESSPATDTLPTFVLLKELDTFAGSTVTVTGTGYIVGYSALAFEPAIYSTIATTSVDAESVPISTTRLSTTAGIDVEFMSALPAGAAPGNYYFVIAEVSLSSGVAVVDKQYLHHNPTLGTYYADGS